MAFRLVVVSILLAVANAGYLSAPSPAAYSESAALAYAHAAIGSQTQSVYRSADGKQAVSMYSKAVDTPYSSVRKYDTRITNDAVAYTPVVPHPVATVAHVAHGPAVAAVVQAPSVAHVAHAPATSYAPAYSSYHHSPHYNTHYAPAVSKVIAAPTASHVTYSHHY
ncbi:hypothetical protein RUM44_001023 [Polyplax serrata]|uniref:Uncharacterized protein n=1 Tax=Polyplax serrata TaxID=468196 RepID=A0ABR1B9B6_POLSC